MPLSNWLEAQPQWVLIAWSVLPAFSSYLCTYAYRKPYTALSYEAVAPIIFGDVAFDYKTLAVIVQRSRAAKKKLRKLR